MLAGAATATGKMTKTATMETTSVAMGEHGVPAYSMGYVCTRMEV
jgi:hypothetical protein